MSTNTVPNGPFRTRSEETAGRSAERPTERRAPGRPRSERVREAILDAALALIARDGYAALTMEGIAREAGVSKQTIYRWWPSRAAVVLEAASHRAAESVPDEDHGELGADVVAFVRHTVRGQTAETRRVLAALIAEAQLDPSFGEAFRARFIAGRRAAFQELFERAEARGELSPSVDLEVLADVVFGALWYRLLSGDTALDQSFADALARAVLATATPTATADRPSGQSGQNQTPDRPGTSTLE